MADRLLDMTVLAEDVREALVLAATKRRGSLTTALLLVEVMRVNRDASGWVRISLQSRSFDQIDPAEWPDPGRQSAATWEDVPLSEDLAAALRIAARLVDEYRLVPVPTVALVLGLIADPASGAARALVEGAGCTHAELVDLIQDNLAGSRFESLDLRHHSDREPDIAAVCRAPAPRVRPVASVPQRFVHGLQERWDWQRAKSLLAGLALLALGVGDVVEVVTPGKVEETGTSPILSTC
jgi:hypothetical protein